MIVFDADSGHVLRTFALPHGVHNFLFSLGGILTSAVTASVKVVSPRGSASS
jgi:hypothetical protein